MALVKGSPQALAWAKKMKKARIRASGLRAEKQFFGPGGEFEDEAAAKRRTNPGRPHGTFTRCVKKVRQSMKEHCRTGSPKKICGAAIARKTGLVTQHKNPIILNSTPRRNPPRDVHANVAGILYHRCLEIRAEKTSAKGLKGLYYHPFLERSQVCILALDNGDLLIHSKIGEALWKVH